MRTAMVLSLLMASLLLLFTNSTHFFHFKKQMNSRTASLIRVHDIPAFGIRVPYDPHASIPFQLWQTYKHKNLTDEAQAAVESWKDLNPHLPIGLHDDDDADAFILRHYGPRVHALYRAFPVGVMRADFWRYAILYQYGGIYSDIDTRCLKPVKEWFPPVLPQDSNHIDQYFNPAHEQVFVLGAKAYDELKWEDCSLVVGLENGHDLCQWVGVVLCKHV
jgi:mannosyltransferase OCH1-like enzyme